MTAIDTIKNFLRETEDISIGYSEINFIDADELEEGQIGYSIDQNGESFDAAQNGNWEKSWVVIASDHLGDPIIVDTADTHLPILTSPHGQGEWVATPLSSSLAQFKNIVAELHTLSVDRQSPVELEDNPIPAEVRERFLNSIAQNNKNMDMDWWEAFLENEDDASPATSNSASTTGLTWWQKLFGMR